MGFTRTAFLGLSMPDPLIVRPATLEDRAALWEWYQQEYRYTLLKRRPLVSERRLHDRWFEAALARSQMKLGIAVVDVLRVGAVRFDQVAPGVFRARLLLKAVYWGRDYAPRMVREGVLLLPASGWHSVVVRVPTQHTDLKRRFLASGFVGSVASSDTAYCELTLLRAGDGT